METMERPKDYARTAKATEYSRQAKYRRWAIEMRDHGWACEAPTDAEIEEMAYARIEGR